MTDGVAKTGESSRARNRVRWFGHVRACAGSGLSVAEYCRREGLQYNSFRRWRLAFRDAGEDFAPAEYGGSGGGAPARGTDATGGSGQDELGVALFAEVDVQSSSSMAEAPALEVVLAGERRIRVAPGFDEETLRRLMAALEGRAC